MVFRDQTEERKQQQAVEESRRQLSTLMSNLPGMAYRFKNDPDWTMLFVSQGCRDLTGYRADDLIDNRVVSYNDLVYSEDQKYVWEKVQEGIANNSRFKVEYRMIDRGGNIRWVWESGQAVLSDEGTIAALEGFITDITERKKAENNLLYHSQILSNIGGSVIAADTNKVVTYWNETAEKLYGWSSQEAVGNKIEDLI